MKVKLIRLLLGANILCIVLFLIFIYWQVDERNCFYEKECIFENTRRLGDALNFKFTDETKINNLSYLCSKKENLLFVDVYVTKEYLSAMEKLQPFLINAGGAGAVDLKHEAMFKKYKINSSDVSYSDHIHRQIGTGFFSRKYQCTLNVYVIRNTSYENLSRIIFISDNVPKLQLDIDNILKESSTISKLVI